MLIEFIRDYYDYSEWANDRILTAAEGLTTEQFLESDLEGIWPIRFSIAHMMLAQWAWIGRWNDGKDSQDDIEETDFADVASIRAFWPGVYDAMRELLDRLDDEQLARDFTYVNYLGETRTYPLGNQLLHVANHSTYHRGEVAALLTRFGCSPGEIDFNRWQDWRRRES
ncbi:MAG: DinB family protein [Thermomicrobiales bacterium]|jgi:uncharacterized damage-inducible protein DinB|nr:DinB family protein [Thermomicrobiales bacterium]